MILALAKKQKGNCKVQQLQFPVAGVLMKMQSFVQIFTFNKRQLKKMTPERSTTKVPDTIYLKKMFKGAFKFYGMHQGLFLIFRQSSRVKSKQPQSD